MSIVRVPRSAMWVALAGTAVIAPPSGETRAQFLPQQNTRQEQVPTGSPVDPPPGTPGSSGTNDRPAASEDYPDPVSGARFGPTEIQEDEAEPNDRETTRNVRAAEPNPRLKPPPPPNEFEKFVERATGRQLPRFGAGLLLPSNRDYATPATSTVPPGYILNVGDAVSIAMTGSVEGSVERTIDTNGRIFLPRVGSIRLAGLRYGDLRDAVERAIGIKYRNFTVTVGIRNLRGIRVYVAGFANNPGAYTVSSLSTLVNAVLAAGGPAAGGSFRSVKLYRNNQLVSDYDLYQLLLRGDRTGDAVLQNEDVLFIPPQGAQVAVSGSVNTEAVFELKSDETLENVLQFAGGPNTLSDQARLLLYRQSNYDSVGVVEVARADAAARPAAGGDIVQVVSAGSLQRSRDKQSVVVRIEGEVNAPGTYYVPPNTPLSKVLARAGGLTSQAFVYGTRFERASARTQQRQAFEDAIRQLEISLAAAPLTADRSNDAGTQAAQAAGARAVLDRLRRAEPDGRMVLDLPPAAATLPGDMILENNDRILVPPRPTTVGVFGAVYRPASFALDQAGRPLRVRDYVEKAGGTLRAADRRDIFVVRASGDVLSRRRSAMNARVLPGDVIFVPVKTQSTSVWAKIRDISTVLFQFGLTAATVAAISN